MMPWQCGQDSVSDFVCNVGACWGIFGPHQNDNSGQKSLEKNEINWQQDDHKDSINMIKK